MNAARKTKTRETDTTEYVIYLKKAKEFYQTMYQAEKSSNWNAVGLTGVHAVISLIDALLVKHSGLRSSDDSHMKVVDLLISSLNNTIKDVTQRSQAARRVIAKKNIVAYENRDFTQKEAMDLIKHVERFYQWATQHL
jgi:hypothetical protein